MATLRALNNYLRMHRKRSGLTQRELAHLLGQTHGSKVSRYERGERLPSFATLIAFEVLFQAPASELFAGAYDRIAKDVRGRASRLHRRLDAEPLTPLMKQKLHSLIEVVYPEPRSETA